MAIGLEGSWLLSGGFQFNESYMPAGEDCEPVGYSGVSRGNKFQAEPTPSAGSLSEFLFYIFFKHQTPHNFVYSY